MIINKVVIEKHTITTYFFIKKCQNYFLDLSPILHLPLPKKLVMEQLLHKITVEFQTLKNKKDINDVHIPSINGNTNIPGINMFFAALFAANRNLSGEYTTIENIRQNEWFVEKNAPRVSFLNYYLSTELLFLKEDIYHHIPGFDKEKATDIKALEELFITEKIVSFGIKHQQKIENTLGNTIKISFQKNILNYNKEEAIPNEYVIGMKIRHTKELSLQEVNKKERIENKLYNNFQEAQQQLFFLFYSYQRANLNMFKPFFLENIGSATELLINSNNNAMIAKSIVQSNKPEYKQIKFY